ncbi:MAG: tetratricopeptide repeat protein [Rickettsia endosymbiont of Pentastiridius leporinus]
MKKNPILKPLPKKNKELNDLRDKILGLLDKVYFSLKEMEEIKESIVIIRHSKDATSDVFDALKLENNINVPHEADILLPKKFISDNKIYWDCSKIKLTTEDDSIIQVIVNLFFIEKLSKITDKIKFVIAVPKDTIMSTHESCTENIGDFIKIFPDEERIKLKDMVTFVVTDCDQSNINVVSQKLENIINNKQGILKYFPRLNDNVKYLNNPDILEDISNIPGEKSIKLNKLYSFLDSNNERKELIASLYTKIQTNVNEIYQRFQDIFIPESFDIYKPYQCHLFKIEDLPNLPFIPKPLAESTSCFKGLQQLFELKTVLEAEDTNTDPLSKGLKILGVIKKFTSNTQDIKIYYWSDRQIEELLFFQETANKSDIDSWIEEVQSFIEKAYLPPITKFVLKSQESIEYYQEAITWLNKYDKPEEIAEIKAACYLEIAEIYNNNKNYKEALANYHYALKYDKQFKEIYYKMANMLSELGYKELAIEFYRIENKEPEILKCFESILKADPENKEIYIKKGDYLLFQKFYEPAAYEYAIASSIEPDPSEQLNKLAKWIGAAMKIPSDAIKPEEITFEARESDIRQIIGNIEEILD